MQIIIEVSGGCVTAVYHRRQKSDAVKPAGIPDVLVVDIDVGQVGQEIEAQQMEVEPISAAGPELHAAIKPTK